MFHEIRFTAFEFPLIPAPSHNAGRIYCDQNGIEEATEEGAKHRCPFLINILESIGIVSQARSAIIVNKFLISKETMQLRPKESEGDILNRINTLKAFLENPNMKLEEEEISLLKEAFGKDFLTDKYYLKDIEILI